MGPQPRRILTLAAGPPLQRYRRGEPALRARADTSDANADGLATVSCKHGRPPAVTHGRRQDDLTPLFAVGSRGWPNVMGMKARIAMCMRWHRTVKADAPAVQRGGSG